MTLQRLWSFASFDMLFFTPGSVFNHHPLPVLFSSPTSPYYDVLSVSDLQVIDHLISLILPVSPLARPLACDVSPCLIGVTKCTNNTLCLSTTCSWSFPCHPPLICYSQVLDRHIEFSGPNRRLFGWCFCDVHLVFLSSFSALLSSMISHPTPSLIFTSRLNVSPHVFVIIF